MSSVRGNGTSSNNRGWATDSSRPLAQQSHRLAAGRPLEHPRSTTGQWRRRRAEGRHRRLPIPHALPSDNSTTHRHGRVPPAPPPRLRSRPTALTDRGSVGRRHPFKTERLHQTQGASIGRIRTSCSKSPPGTSSTEKPQIPHRSWHSSTDRRNNSSSSVHAPRRTTTTSGAASSSRSASGSGTTVPHLSTHCNPPQCNGHRRSTWIAATAAFAIQSRLFACREPLERGAWADPAGK